MLIAYLMMVVLSFPRKCYLEELQKPDRKFSSCMVLGSSGALDE